jgi:hypothetical protein
MLAFLVVIGMLIAAAWVLIDLNKKKERHEALEEYQSCLRQLKANPTNPGLRERALKSGRAYANLTRDKNGDLLIDEAALQNDINAVCAEATTAKH